MISSVDAPWIVVFAHDFDALTAEHRLLMRRHVALQQDWLGKLDTDKKLAAAERQVGELREQLAAANRNAEYQLKFRKLAIDRLDTAMRLLRHIDSDMPHSFREGWKAEVRAFLNTTSTEGKDHG